MLLAVSSCRRGESIVFLFITHYSLFITHLHNDFSRLWSMNGYQLWYDTAALPGRPSFCSVI